MFPEHDSPLPCLTHTHRKSPCFPGGIPIDWARQIPRNCPASTLPPACRAGWRATRPKQLSVVFGGLSYLADIAITCEYGISGRAWPRSHDLAATLAGPRRGSRGRPMPHASSLLPKATPLRDPMPPDVLIRCVGPSRRAGPRFHDSYASARWRTTGIGLSLHTAQALVAACPQPMKSRRSSQRRLRGLAVSSWRPRVSTALVRL